METHPDAFKDDDEPSVPASLPSPATPSDVATPTDLLPQSPPPPPPPPPIENGVSPEANEDEISAGNPNGCKPSNTNSSQDEDEEEEDNENENENDEDDDNSDDNSTEPPSKKQKQLSFLTGSTDVPSLTPKTIPTATSSSKKSKKKNNNVWTKPASRKGKKKGKSNNGSSNAANSTKDDAVLITPVARFPDKNDDSPDTSICLSKVYKAEKVDVSEDRLSAGSTKGYRMVRATRGVVEGAWYYEIKVVSLGETGHTRLGWSNEKGDLQAPVGYDGNSFGYRDIDGSKVHKAVREKYGEEGYKEGDVIGFYINLPEGEKYTPVVPHLVWYKGQRYACAQDGKDDPPKVVPGSEISFFKNGVCQGAAFKDIYGGRYYPAASMYTLPNQPNCVVRFNFGPDFESFPQDFGGRMVPRPMIEVPYHGYDSRVENGELNGASQ